MIQLEYEMTCTGSSDANMESAVTHDMAHDSNRNFEKFLR